MGRGDLTRAARHLGYDAASVPAILREPRALRYGDAGSRLWWATAPHIPPGVVTVVPGDELFGDPEAEPPGVTPADLRRSLGDHPGVTGITEAPGQPAPNCGDALEFGRQDE